MPTPAQLLTFRTNGCTYACDLLWVREILRQPALTPVDRAPASVRGLIHLRGQILTAIDLESRLGLPLRRDPPTARCIVFKTTLELTRLACPPADSDLAGQDLVGVIVDTIGDILPLPESILPPPPGSLSGLDPDCIAGVIPRPEGLVTLLNIGALLSLPATA